MNTFGFTIQTFGELLIAYTVLRVHGRVRQEHKIDARVFAAMKREQVIGATGMMLIVVGWLVQVVAK